MRTLSYCRQKDSYTFRKNLFNFDKLNYRTRPNMRSPSKVNQNSKVKYDCSTNYELLYAFWYFSFKCMNGILGKL